MLEFAIITAGIVLLGGGFYLRWKMPWPFMYEGQKYRRMPDGTFQEATTRTAVENLLLIPKLQEAYETAKYGRRDMSDLDLD